MGAEKKWDSSLCLESLREANLAAVDETQPLPFPASVRVWGTRAVVVVVVVVVVGVVAAVERACA